MTPKEHSAEQEHSATSESTVILFLFFCDALVILSWFSIFVICQFNGLHFSWKNNYNFKLLRIRDFSIRMHIQILHRIEPENGKSAARFSQVWDGHRGKAFRIQVRGCTKCLSMLGMWCVGGRVCSQRGASQFPMCENPRWMCASK